MPEDPSETSNQTDPEGALLGTSSSLKMPSSRTALIPFEPLKRVGRSEIPVPEGIIKGDPRVFPLASLK